MKSLLRDIRNKTVLCSCKISTRHNPREEFCPVHNNFITQEEFNLGADRRASSSAKMTDDTDALQNLTIQIADHIIRSKHKAPIKQPKF